MIIHTDIRHLSDAIDYYKDINSGNSPYIFMNRKTMKETNLVELSMIRNFAYDLDEYNVYDAIFECMGCRTFEDNTLGFFEVELR